jgi:hypothetical protein
MVEPSSDDKQPVVIYEETEQFPSVLSSGMATRKVTFIKTSFTEKNSTDKQDMETAKMMMESASTPERKDFPARMSKSV